MSFEYCEKFVKTGIHSYYDALTKKCYVKVCAHSIFERFDPVTALIM